MKFTKKSIMAIIQALVVVVPFVMMFLTCVTQKGITKSYDYNAFDAYFGGANGLEFNGTGIFLLIFIVIIFIISVLKVFFNKGNLSKGLNVIIVILSIICTIFFFCSTTGMMLTATYGEIADYSFKIGYAAIVAGIFSALNALLSIGDIVLLKD